MRPSRWISTRNLGRTPQPHVGLYMLLLAIELYKDEEQVYKFHQL